MPCIHHWLLQSSASNNVPAECRNCGVTRTFKGHEEVPVDKFRHARQLVTYKNKEKTDWAGEEVTRSRWYESL